jgi:hypothetical protein
LEVPKNFDEKTACSFMLKKFQGNAQKEELFLFNVMRRDKAVLKKGHHTNSHFYTSL